MVRVEADTRAINMVVMVKLTATAHMAPSAEEVGARTMVDRAIDYLQGLLICINLLYEARRSYGFSDLLSIKIHASILYPSSLVYST